MINKDTQLFVSVSSHPGNFGASLYNTAFKEIGYNAIYKPLKCDSISQLVDIVRYAKNYSISGISVSMPYKKIALNLGTFGDDEVGLIGNANTLVFDKDPAPKAYNTDSNGFEDANWNILGKAKFAVIVGKGAMSDSIQYALEQHNVSFVCLSSRVGATLRPAVEQPDWLINASPIGMDHVEDTFFTEDFVGEFNFVSDVVLKKETNLIKLAKKLNIQCINGIALSLEQLCGQWEHYTATAAPREIFQEVLRENNFV